MNNNNNINKQTIEKASTMPETLDVSNVVQANDSRLIEKNVCEEYIPWGKCPRDRRLQVTLGTDAPFDQSSALLPHNNVPLWKESSSWRHHKKTTRRTIHTTNKLAGANAQWKLHHQNVPQTISSRNTTDNNRNVSFINESAATILYLETEKEQCKGNRPDSRRQWKNFTHIVDYLKRNDGMHAYVAQKLLKICRDCRDKGLDFSFAAIEGHENLYHLAGRLSRYRIAELCNKMMDGVQVTLWCPLELSPNPLKRKFGDSSSSGESGGGKRRRLNDSPELCNMMDGVQVTPLFCPVELSPFPLAVPGNDSDASHLTMRMSTRMRMPKTLFFSLPLPMTMTMTPLTKKPLTIRHLKLLLPNRSHSISLVVLQGSLLLPLVSCCARSILVLLAPFARNHRM